MRDKPGPNVLRDHRPQSAGMQQQQQQQQQQRQQQQRRRSRQASPFYVASSSDGAAIVNLGINNNSNNNRQRRLSLGEESTATVDSQELVSIFCSDRQLSSNRNYPGRMPPNIHKARRAAAEADRDPSVTQQLLSPPSTPPPPAMFAKSDGSAAAAAAATGVVDPEDFSDMSLPAHLSQRHALSRASSFAEGGGKANSKTSAVGSFFIISLLLCSGYFLRDYVSWVLVAAENQDDAVLILILTLLYAIVSLPFAWGYILINIATGYLYGVVKGTIVTVVTVALGVFLAHHLIRACMSKYVRRWIISSSTLSESLDAVMSSKHQAFKIVLLSRLTPVPFGLQNAIFAVNCPLSTYRYLQATMIGLLPCQIINAYLGSTFRSMEQLLNDSETTQIGTVILGAQLAVAVAVTYFVVKKAKSELDRSLEKKMQEEEEQANLDNNNVDLDLEKGVETAVKEMPNATVHQL